MGNQTQVLEDARRFYRQSARQPGCWVGRHMSARGLEAMVDRASIGYAPPGWTTTTSHLLSLGHQLGDLIHAGVSIDGGRGPRDVMHDRLMFPVQDHNGHLVGFLGRSNPDDLKSSAPKYMNTPATELFEKRATLYGLGESAAALAAGAVPLIVEGPMDRLAVEQAAEQHGLHVVGLAACGTALTAEHIARVQAVSPAPLWYCFDGDAAGRRALLRAWDLTAVTGRSEQRVVQLPASADPASVSPARLAKEILRAAPMSVAVAQVQLEVWGRPDSWLKAELMVSSLAERDASRITPEASTAWITTVARWTDLPVSSVQATLIEHVAPRPSSTDLDAVRAASFPRQVMNGRGAAVHCSATPRTPQRSAKVSQLGR